MELVLIRHGLPLRREVQEGVADPPLSPTGREQAQRVANWLAHDDYDAVYSSTMIRARETAEPFAKAHGFEIQERDGIVEFDRDDQSYVPLEVLKVEDYEAWLAFAEGRNLEDVDLQRFYSTVVRTLEELIASHAGQRIAVFCHGGVVNFWTAHVLGLSPSFFFEPKYTSIHRYLCASTGQRNILSLNEAGHLRGMVES